MFSNTKCNTNCTPQEFSHWTIKKRCCMVSCSLQKQVHPFHRLLARLSLVKITHFLRHHRIFFILSGIFAFQVQQLKGIPVPTTKSLYMAFTKNKKHLLLVQMKESLCPLIRRTLIKKRRTVRIPPPTVATWPNSPPLKPFKNRRSMFHYKSVDPPGVCLPYQQEPGNHPLEWVVSTCSLIVSMCLKYAPGQPQIFFKVHEDGWLGHVHVPKPSCNFYI
jgi:hypothetical protein